MEYHIARIVAWLEPFRYSETDSYQILQGLYAIGSGGFLGVGLGNSRQKVLIPEAQNDIIGCIIAEELGVIGVIILMILLVFLIFQIFVIAINTKDLFGTLLCSCIMLHLAYQAITNIAVATNSIPNTGVSLPFISSGGSSMVIAFAQIGIVISVLKYQHT